MALSMTALMAQARRHWTMWLPEKVRELKAAGELESELQAVAKMAMRRAQELMQQGYRPHEAEEVVLAEYILLSPEPGAEEEDWEREENARLEAEYREEMRAFLAPDEEDETRDRRN
ncbi:hypothetical protein [uncultured Azohydromonas sp.]|jgi:hypothetical protein|uniref:hypothetical protein n=1 Tax=uncultured Azohydromonas sp. TaxID=487342 RepID=UPI00260FEA9A|nr:hypothetical protein [uncultured Azohydromonas sp.]